jgi:hypothetical protein
MEFFPEIADYCNGLKDYFPRSYKVLLHVFFYASQNNLLSILYMK